MVRLRVRPVELGYSGRVADRSRDWLAQAERDLDVAVALAERGIHE